MVYGSSVITRSLLLVSDLVTYFFKKKHRSWPAFIGVKICETMFLCFSHKMNIFWHTQYLLLHMSKLNYKNLFSISVLFKMPLNLRWEYFSQSCVVKLVDGEGIKMSRESEWDGVSPGSGWGHRRQQENIKQFELKKIFCLFQGHYMTVCK